MEFFIWSLKTCMIFTMVLDIVVSHTPLTYWPYMATYVFIHNIFTYNIHNLFINNYMESTHEHPIETKTRFTDKPSYDNIRF